MTPSKRKPAPKGPPAASSRSLWKGAISFGLVHIPIGLYSATSSTDIDFDWLDKRSMQPVGYKRINKVTGKEVAPADIVKGVEYDPGRYVVLTAQEIAAAFPKAMQTIEIEAFVEADDIPFVYLERPYYTAPLGRGHKAYALLREALRKSRKVGVAKVVIQNRQHLAVLIPCGPALVLNLLRWGAEIRSFEPLDLPSTDARQAGIKAAEMAMAVALIEDMTQPWRADQFRDSFSDEIHKLVQAKARTGEVQAVPSADAPPLARAGADVVDLTALLKSSLTKGARAQGPSPAAGAGPKASVRRLPTRKTAASKRSPPAAQTASTPPARKRSTGR